MTADVVTLRPAQKALGEIAVAVVIPAFKQPGLLLEALDSVVQQRAGFGVAAVVVDDGCPFTETRDVALAYARRHGGRICYVRQANGGLSAARNAGIAFALRAWPSVSALYMLDADNRLHPEFLSRAYALLAESPADVGWVYPDFDMFGVPFNHSTRGSYTAVMHLLENMCEAGSLIRRTLFDAGLRFNEMMRTGQEDWDFWLQAASAGFRGRHLPRSGFQYRKRLESMLSADEERSANIARMRQRHLALSHPRAVVARAQDEMPNFALYMEDGAVRLIADPTLPEEGRRLSVAAARREFLEAMENPAAAWFPPVLCFADPAALATLKNNKLVRNVFWRAEVLLRDCKVIAARVERGEPGRLSLAAEDVPAEEAFTTAQLLFIRARTVMSLLREPHDGAELSASGRIRTLRATVPPEAKARGGEDKELPLGRRLGEEIAGLGAALAERSRLMPADWRFDNRPHRSAEAVFSVLLGCQTIYPHRKKDGVRDFGVLLPVCEFGGIERGKGNYASVLRERGWRPHLFITREESAYLSPLAFEAYESVNFVSIEDAEKHSASQHYFGMWTSEFGRHGRANDLIGLLGGMDALINNHSFAGHAVAAKLRRFGVNTTVGVHMTERTPVGNPLGTPHSILGYEHAYDGITVISDMLREWCIGQGVPEEKLHLVRNAPSYPPAKGAIARSLKAKKRHDGPLRVLFIGRLDRQKGLDRLAEIIRRTKGSPIVWRFVGKAVIEDSGVELAAAGVEIEPPVNTAEELDALYAWADVMILTSRFEGVPLSILEAQRAGCVALSTDVGAVGEIIAHEVDGLVVPVATDEETIVGTFCSHLERLARDRRLVRTIGLRAARRVSRVRWDRNMKDWIVQLEAACDAAARARPRVPRIAE